MQEAESSEGMLLEDHSESLLVKGKHPASTACVEAEKSQSGMHLFFWCMLHAFIHQIILTCAPKGTG